MSGLGRHTEHDPTVRESPTYRQGKRKKFFQAMPSSKGNFDGISVEEGRGKELPKSRKPWTRNIVVAAMVLAVALLIVGIVMVVQGVQALGNNASTGSST